ncbi:formate dehydrogenase subunit delta [Paraburkholderia sp. GAS448]|jgi:formate dehydrogenase subunit delta|uniref:formate dehydrogenase subunit delta n=1 Tax=Paraburkholderia sp. GAS448 TaxID=3035136 RepID=UPI003D19ACCE
MDAQNLIEMANRIGEFFESMPDHDEALAGIADHIRCFWEPRMRRALLAVLDTSNKEALCQIMREALAGHRAELTPAQA